MGIAKKFNFKNEIIYARKNGISEEDALRRVIKQEKEWCKRSIFLAIELHDLIDFTVDVGDDSELIVTARLREVVPPDKVEAIKRQSNAENNI